MNCGGKRNVERDRTTRFINYDLFTIIPNGLLYFRFWVRNDLDLKYFTLLVCFQLNVFIMNSYLKIK